MNQPHDPKRAHPVEPGAEAAEPSPGDRQRGPEPSTEDLADIDRMYEDAAKKLAKEGAADPEDPATTGR